MSGARAWWRSWAGGRSTGHSLVEETGILDVRGLAPRRAKVYLPPGYDVACAEPYPLLVALDGQTMPQWRLGETLNELVGVRQVEPVVVAAVPATPDRIDEYGTANELDFAGRGRKAKAFQELLAGVLLPWMREHYHVTDRPARTGIFGASMGGLCAFDSTWRRPQVFGLAGVFSGSLWWRGDDSSAAAQQASRIVHRYVRRAASKPAVRVWFQTGTADEAADRDQNGVIDVIQDTIELMDELEAIGFRRDAEIAYLEIADGGHQEETWARALPAFLRWALPPRHNQGVFAK